MKKNALTLAIAREKLYLWSASGVLLVLVGSYMYLVSASVVHVVIQKEINKDMRALHSEIAALETEYIDAQHAVSNNLASLDGFVETTDKIFLDRTPASLVLSSQ